MIEHTAVAFFLKKILPTEFPAPLPGTSCMLSWVSGSINFLQHSEAGRASSWYDYSYVAKSTEANKSSWNFCLD